MKRDLQRRINNMGPVVERLIELLVDRLEQGHKEYGEWKIGDGRDYIEEALWEALDGMAYLGKLLLELEIMLGKHRGDHD